MPAADNSPEAFNMRVAQALNNAALAHRLTMVKNSRRNFNKSETDAFLEEAARRLRWRDAYDKHGGGE
jgi:hypothetical protein